MSFDEANTIRDGIRDHLQKIGWEYVPRTRLPRSEGDVLVEPYLREALIQLNPEIAARPDRADEVIYKLRTILLSVQSEGLVRSNERFAEIVFAGIEDSGTLQEKIMGFVQREEPVAVEGDPAVA